MKNYTRREICGKRVGESQPLIMSMFDQRDNYISNLEDNIESGMSIIFKMNVYI